MIISSQKLFQNLRLKFHVKTKCFQIDSIHDKIFKGFLNLKQLMAEN